MPVHELKIDIETERVAARLRDFGCDIAQGYLYAKHGDAGDLPACNFDIRVSHRFA